jgi:acetyl esterase/lipase
MVTAAQAIRLAKVYLDGADAHDPLASPLHADLTGLPPLLAVTGSEEILLDDTTRLIARAQAAGVEAEAQIWDGMIHTFPVFVGMFPEADEAVEAVAAFLQKRLGSAAGPR